MWKDCIRNSESCCAPIECCGGNKLISVVQMAKNIGYGAKESEAQPVKTL